MTSRKRRPRHHNRWQQILARLRPAEVELLLFLALFGQAFLVRWPYLLRLPHFTDEMGEVRWALGIWRGEHLPFTAQETYLGALHAYLLAGCLWLFGPSVALPRLLVCVIGALTVAFTYLLGRELAGRAVGVLGAALLLTLPQHIVVNSHVAWQNSTTPLYTTIACIALLKGLAVADPASSWRAARWFLLAGLAFGLAFQTHLGVIVLAPALLLACVWRLWRGQRGALLWATAFGGVGAVVGAAPLLGYNLVHRLVGVERVQRSRGYAFETDHSPLAYLRNLKNLLLELARMVSNPFQVPERFTGYLTSFQLLVMVALAVGGIWLLARRGQPLPLLALLTTALMMPYFNHAYGVDGDRPLVTGRYVAFLLPPLLVACATAFLALMQVGGRWLAHLFQRSRSLQLLLVSFSGASAAALTLLLVLYPLLPLTRYYHEESARDPANETFLTTLRVVQQQRSAQTPVLLDRNGLVNIDLRDGASAFDILDLLLTLDQIPHQVTRNPAADLPQAVGNASNPTTFPLIIMMRDECWPLREQLPLQRVSGRLVLRELYPTVPSYYGVYRYLPGQQQIAGCLPSEGATPGD